MFNSTEGKNVKYEGLCREQKHGCRVMLSA